MSSPPTPLWRAKVYSLAFGALMFLWSFLTSVKGGLGGRGGCKLHTSDTAISWQHAGRVCGARFPSANTECLWYYKIHCVSVCQNLMTFTQPGTYLLQKLLLSPYHTAPGTIGRSLIAQWYRYNREGAAVRVVAISSLSSSLFCFIQDSPGFWILGNHSLGPVPSPPPPQKKTKTEWGKENSR